MGVEMLLITIVALALFISGLLAYVVKRHRVKRELEKSCIDAETLRSMMESNEKVTIYDIRQPLDLLAYSETIPGAVRIPPNDLLENPTLIPRDEDAVVYCTCPGEKTSWSIVNKARSLEFTRLKLLRGGLAAWKSKGYPVEPYKESFHLDTAR
jgi:rhodanese-related sulfurtransferase